jgi:hypothetical protein
MIRPQPAPRARGCQGAAGGANVLATGVAAHEGDGELGQLIAKVAHLGLAGWLEFPAWIVDRDEIHLHAHASEKLGQIPRGLPAHVHARHAHIGQGHALLADGRVLAHGLGQLVERPALFDGHERQAHLARGRGQRDDEAKALLLGGETPDGRHDARGGNGNGVGGDGQAGGMAKHARGTHDVVVVEQRLAHAQEEHASDGMVGLVCDGLNLGQDFPGGEIARKTKPPVAQKAQARAQPTCELMHTVYLAVGRATKPSASPRRRFSFKARASAGSGSGMRTASICAPSGRRNRYLTKPSAARRRSTTSMSG